MRNVILLVLGMAIGALAAANIVNALRQRDAYPRGLMQVMQHHYQALREDVRLHQCTATSSQDLQVLRQLSSGIETAIYGTAAPAAPFHKYAIGLHAALAAAPSGVMPSDCVTLAPALKKIGAACDTCHRQYR